MIPSAFAYERASSVQEAIELLRASDGEGKLIAGGHSLLPMMKLRLTSPGTLIDISGIEGLRAVKVTGDRLSVGALLTHYQIMTNPLVRERLLFLLKRLAKLEIFKSVIAGRLEEISHMQIRHLIFLQ